MKHLLLFAMLNLYSCSSELILTAEDQNEIYNITNKINNIFFPEDMNIIFNHFAKRWEYFDKPELDPVDATVIKADAKNKFNLLAKSNIISDKYQKTLSKRISKDDAANFAMILTNNIMGDELYKILPLKDEIGKSIGSEDGDGYIEEYMKMSDQELDEFFKTRIFVTKTNKVVMKTPYDEIAIGTEFDRAGYACYIFYVKDKVKGWLIDDITIEDYYKY